METQQAQDVPPKANREGRFGSDVAVRTRSALVLGLSVLALTGLGGWPFVAFTAVLAGLVLGEWLSVTGCRKFLIFPGDFIIATAAVVVLFAGLGAEVAALAVGVLMVCVVLVGPDADRGVTSRIWAGFGVIYAILPAIALQSLRGSAHDGLWALVFLFAVVWSTDIAAFFAGRAFGGPRLMAVISPKKTWSGAVGGLIGALAAGTCVALLAHVPNVLPVIAIAAASSVMTQVGDLFESWIKRCFLVKDSGHLIPGHGGVMDRVDGLVAAAVFLALTGWSRAGLDDPASGFLNW